MGTALAIRADPTAAGLRRQRERFLSLRVSADYRAVAAACCAAWNRPAAEPGRLRSRCDQPWIEKVTS